MSIFTDFKSSPLPFTLTPPEIEILQAPALPDSHPAEADVFARHDDIPGHQQQALENARIALVGAGGLNSWVAVGLVKTGAKELLVIDHDIVDRTNLTRQFYTAADLGKPKAQRLIHNLSPLGTAAPRLTAVPFRFEHALHQVALPVDLLVVGVDNNAARRACALHARAQRIPAVFTMLSRDGMRCHVFFQGPDPEDACLWCALPNLDPERAAPCAAAIVSSCFLAAAYTIFFAHRALMGWSPSMERFNWREGDLTGAVADRTGSISRRADCPLCSEFAR